MRKKQPMNEQPEQRKLPQRRMIYGLVFAITIVFGTLLGVVLGYGSLGIVLSVIVGILIGAFNIDTLKNSKGKEKLDT